MNKIAEEVRAMFAALGADAKLSPSNRPDLADFMCDAAFGAAKTLRKPPQEIAQTVCNALSHNGYTASVTGGFLNISLDDRTIIDGFFANGRWQATGETYIIDSGGPNTAKPMHVGHLRSLVIGDALAGILRYVGHDVIKDIHYGDWGFQMGLLLAYLPVIPDDIGALEAAYPIAAQKAKDDPAFKAEAHRAVVALQNGEPDHVARWKQLRALSEKSVFADLKTLGVSFDLYLGESDAFHFANIARMTLQRKGRLIESEGAQIVETENGPLMFRNREGGYLYGATDLGTAIQREHDFYKPEQKLTALYVVDERQSQYFKQMLEAVDIISHNGNYTREHIPFGTVNGPDGKPFKTRAGGVPRLSDLMAEAIEKAEAKATDRASSGSARAVAMAALKFGDLINRRTGSYSFDIDKALRFEGKTGPYLLYQIVRMRAIMEQREVDAGDIMLIDADERNLALHLYNFHEMIRKAAETRMPHLVAEYTYGLASRFAKMYSGRSIKDSPSRIALTDVVLIRMEFLMNMLGIETVAAM